MTEQEWLECNDTHRMLVYLQAQNASHRKLRLFGCARFRSFWHLFDEVDQRAVEISEQYADKQATVVELRSASDAVWSMESTRSQSPTWRLAAGAASESDPTGEGWWDNAWEFYNTADAAEVAALQAAAEAETHLIRDIFGNPFRTVTIDPAWLTSTVVSLATAIYDERAFDRLPFLADALEDAGCTSADLLRHCREPRAHVRGCWPLDLILGRR